MPIKPSVRFDLPIKLSVRFELPYERVIQ